MWLRPAIEVIRIEEVGFEAEYDSLNIVNLTVTVRNVGNFTAFLRGGTVYGIPLGYWFNQPLVIILDGKHVLGWYSWPEDYIRVREPPAEIPIVRVKPGETKTITVGVYGDVLGMYGGWTKWLKYTNLTRKHTLTVIGRYTNSSALYTIPAPDIKMQVVGIERGKGLGEWELRIKVVNEWIAPVSADWVEVYVDGRKLDESEYLSYVMGVRNDVVLPGEEGLLIIKLHYIAEDAKNIEVRLLQSRATIQLP